MRCIKEEKADDAESANADGIRPEIKDALDSYEAFFDEYCELNDAELLYYTEVNSRITKKLMEVSVSIGE